jgi:hypothetical protein
MTIPFNRVAVLEEYSVAVWGQPHDLALLYLARPVPEAWPVTPVHPWEPELNHFCPESFSSANLGMWSSLT